MQRIFHGFLFIHRYPPFFPSSPFESLFFIYYKTTERKSNQREHEKYINGRLLAVEYFRAACFDKSGKHGIVDMALAIGVAIADGVGGEHGIMPGGAFIHVPAPDGDCVRPR